jgi:hypothetical protein
MHDAINHPRCLHVRVKAPLRSICLAWPSASRRLPRVGIDRIYIYKPYDTEVGPVTGRAGRISLVRCIDPSMYDLVDYCIVSAISAVSVYFLIL